MSGSFVDAEEQDEVLKMFVDESRDHLANIEADLLLIEEGGEAIDEALVNKVFRAAHSIKGGSGFLGLNKVKELAHRAEMVLDMLRSRKMAPNAEVTNILLAAFDRLRELVNNTEMSEEADIAELLVSLTGLASSYLPIEEKASVTAVVELTPHSGGTRVSLPWTDVDRAARTGQRIYLIDCDLIHDIEKKGLNVMSVFGDLSTRCEILDCVVDTEAVGNLEGPIGNRVPLRLIIATAFEPGNIGGFLDGIGVERTHLLSDPGVAKPKAAPVSSPPPSALAPTPPPVPEPGPPLEGPSPEARRGCADLASSASVAGEPGGQAPQSDDTLRVNVELLESLMNLAGGARPEPESA